MNPVLIKVLKTVTKLVVSGLALVFVFGKIDLPYVGSLVRKSHILLLLLAGLFFILSKIISAYRLNYFFRSVKIMIPGMSNLKLYWLGMFYNLFLPGGIGGDGYKVYYLHTKLDSPVKKSILATVFDRLSGLLALLLLCLIFALFIQEKPVSNAVLLATACFGIILFYLIVHRWFHDFFPTLHITNILAFATQVSQVISAFLILKALGNEVHTFEYLFVFLLSSVVAVIPFTIGGIGAREIAFLYAAGYLNLDTSLSIALSLLFFFITVLVSLTGIVYVYRPESVYPQNRQIAD